MTDPHRPDDGILAALVRAREEAANHMAEADQAGNTWHEQAVSEVIWRAARPHIKSADFNPRQERAIGADWLWWWINGRDEGFGMLVQAKRLTLPSSRPTLRFAYREGEQMERLFAAADDLRVPATYMVYFGAPGYRGGLACTPDDDATRCALCRRRSVSILTAEQVRYRGKLGAADPMEFYRAAIPLEDLVNPVAAPLVDLNLDHAEPRLRRLLLTGESGPQQVCREILRLLSVVRATQFSQRYADSRQDAAAEALREQREYAFGQLDPDSVFVDVPQDTGHFAGPYFPHVLRGLRRTVPAYVHDVLADQPLPEELARLVAGVVVVRC